MPWNAVYLSAALADNPDPSVGDSLEKRIVLSVYRRARPSGDLHVEPYGSAWCAREEGDGEPRLICPSRHEAFVWASEVAHRCCRRMFVHRSDGEVVASFDFRC